MGGILVGLDSGGDSDGMFLFLGLGVVGWGVTISEKALSGDVSVFRAGF